MRIDALRIEGFGKLSGREFVFPPDKAVLIVDDNEAGKSTLAGALLYGLCGLPPTKGARPKGGLRIDEVYRPWGDGPYALELDITASGGEFTIYRDFDRKSFSVMDRRTGRDVSSELGFEPDLAAHFLGLPREDFERIAFIRGKDAHSFKASSGMRSRLSAVVDASPSGAEEAIEALQSTKVKLDMSGDLKPTSALGRLANNLADKQAKVRKLEDDLATGEYQTLLGLRSRLAGLDSEIAELDKQRAAARLNELNAKLASADANARELAEVDEEAAGLEEQRRKYHARCGAGSGAAVNEGLLQEITTALSESKNAASAAQNQQAAVTAQEDRFRSEGIDVSATVAFSEKMSALSAEDEQFLRRLRTSRAELSARAEKSGAEAISSRSQLERLQHDRKAASRAGKGAMIAGLGAAVLAGALFAAGKLAGTASIAIGLAGVLAAAAGFVWSVLAQSKRSDESAKYRMDAESAEKEAAAARAEMESSEDQIARLAVEMGYPDSASLTRDLDRWDISRDRIKPLLEAREAVKREERAARDAQNRAKGLLVRLGIDASTYTCDQLDQARDDLSAHLKTIQRLRQLRDELIPAAQARTTSAEEARSIRDEIAGIVRAYGADLPETSRTMVEAEKLRQDAQTTHKSLSDEANRLETTIAAEVEAYRREYPGLLEDIARLTCREVSVRRFDSATTIAAETLREVSDRSRRKWADALNCGSTAILQRFCPAYDTFLFDDNLDFTIKNVETGRQLQKAEIDCCLSTGAKDQLYIAFKLACCDELSRDTEALPVVLDDPLIASDDKRFGDALDYLLSEYADRHHVIILTCHQSRHELALAQSHFAGRCVTLRV